ncbi:protease inhibitor I42 family protein [Acetobacter orleanensis]|uniref:Proteinase inhibitor I42 chagasin domain-containing protein n=1 Tax=Acetobacter orleanensis TaxID=104099 RepID=A0A4Y3TFX5_9PROT|nr:protease inhibitor I42 family protein [Acetobacter orleanensis]KXV62110.1 hypothetical protein AD949_12745 [Acetobacter orleanensis]PCD80452.1 proteinase IV [Acetobacter orleanensis]GAN67476.1 hypothetical protein Abol_003_102 [Acetobacter orleanensis JCM 7639]GBR26507.1 hypothetical protein AA0473_1160 [Acetobacter orleanensis NRIC 0473]GEB81811.1 hypothetical protein AOR01nite_02880 [Acetobacter orleanensis]
MKKLIVFLAIMIPNIAFADDGAITSKVNDTFNFELKSNPSTGYGWMIKKIPDNVVLFSMSYIPSKDCENGMAGCGGVERFYFKSIKAGSGKIELKYGRAFESLPKESTFKYVNVTK